MFDFDKSSNKMGKNRAEKAEKLRLICVFQMGIIAQPKNQNSGFRFSVQPKFEVFFYLNRNSSFRFLIRIHHYLWKALEEVSNRVDDRSNTKRAESI